MEGHAEAAKRYFQETRRLCPGAGDYLRQRLQLEEDGSAFPPRILPAPSTLPESGISTSRFAD